MNRYILAALMARSNMGQCLDAMHVESALRRPPSDLSSAVFELCGLFMESESDEDLWLEEAEGWYDQLTQLTDGEIEEMYPRVAAAYRCAEGTARSHARTTQ